MHNPMLSKMIAEARIADLARASRARQHVERSAPKVPSVSHVTLRFAFPDDERALRRLATLDSSADHLVKLRRPRAAHLAGDGRRRRSPLARLRARLA
jgi:hypothetical protein